MWAFVILKNIIPTWEVLYKNIIIYIYTIKITAVLTLEIIYDIYYINNITQCDNKVGMLLQIGLRVVYNKYIRQMKSLYPYMWYYLP